MKTDLFGEAIVDQIRPVRGALPMECKMFMVASWYAPERRWKIWPDEYPTREEAEKFITEKLNGVRGHTHATIVELRLPGVLQSVANDKETSA